MSDLLIIGAGGHGRVKVEYKIPVIIHPKASVSKYSFIKDGTVIFAGAVINTNASIGKGCIVNVNSCVDHDCIVENGVHVCSGQLSEVCVG
ncbi:hypothetical protein [Clostridium sp.]|uniref:hypothetical protein n=1 Tax=Clostridium sp. TaxID=1506 RepID=UPI003D6C911A